MGLLRSVLIKLHLWEYIAGPPYDILGIKIHRPWPHEACRLNEFWDQAWEEPLFDYSAPTHFTYKWAKEPNTEHPNNFGIKNEPPRT